MKVRAQLVIEREPVALVAAKPIVDEEPGERNVTKVACTLPSTTVNCTTLT
jgi:hypothetical protein